MELKDINTNPKDFKVGDSIRLQGTVYLIGHIESRPSGITLRLERKFQTPIFLDIDNK